MQPGEPSGDEERDEDDPTAGPPDATEAQTADLLGVGRYKKHILVCVGPSCCSPVQGLETWGYLKQRLRQLEAAGRLPPQAVFRSKVACLRICRGGPIAIVYPEGVWYRGVSPAVCERILIEHVGQGRVVEEQAFGFNPLGVRLSERGEEGGA